MAAKLCKDEGGILAETKKPELLEDLIEYAGNISYHQNLSTSYFWLGLRYDQQRGEFVWDSAQETLDKNITGTGNFWYNDRPSYGGIYVYMQMNKKQEWRIDDEQTDIITFKPICQKHVNKNIPGSPVAQLNKTDCNSPWKFHSGKCFRFMMDSCPFGCSLEEGGKVCEAENAILAEPDFDVNDEDDDGKQDLNDYKFLKNLADQTHPISNWWIGITDRSTEGTFRKESSKAVSSNIAHFFNKDRPTSEKKDCLYLKKGSKLRHAQCDKVVDTKLKDFAPQPLCMRVDGDKAHLYL